MKKIIASYSLAFILFALLEALWLTQAAPHIYQPALSDIMAENPNGLAALAFFIGYPAGVLYFAILPSFDHKGRTAHIGKAMTRGAMLGLLCYGTYSLTNLVTLQGWTAAITMFDLGWGMTLSGLTAAGTAAIIGKIYAPQ